MKNFTGSPMASFLFKWRVLPSNPRRFVGETPATLPSENGITAFLLKGYPITYLERSNLP